ncbi:MAG: hypothetical protein U9Q40_09305, partial [Campylobacterota bacterium]|nr:hypothetical protein [Campylobacterota bacterium]
MRTKKLKFSVGCVEKMQDGEFIAKEVSSTILRPPEQQYKGKETQTKSGQGRPHTLIHGGTIMALTINTNVASLNAQRNLGTSQSSLNKSMQRLSSGLRINSAKDD